MNFNQDAVIRVGSPPPGNNQGWVTRMVHFRDFASLSTERGVRVVSPEFEGFGNRWRLDIYPGGSTTAAEGMVSLGLCNMSDKAIEIYYGFSVNDGNGKQVAYERIATPEHFGPVGNGSSWGLPDFATRSVLSSALFDGTSIIEVHMKTAKPMKSVPPPFIPENPFGKQMQRLFLNDKFADIVFEVNGAEQPKDNARKVAKTAPVAIPAHFLIVANFSSILAELCESHGDKLTPISISGVSPDIFRVLLNYMYGGKLSEDGMKSHAKEIIDAADKYGVVNLKLEAEASFVVGTTFTIENVMELLLYAESKNCALLKEAAMDYIVENKAEVIKKLSFANAPGTLMRDLLVATARGERNVDGSDGDVDDESRFNAMRISELRKRAHEKGLNVDGSREMLIAALEAVQNLESEVGLEDGSSSSDEEPEED